jgi:hypothetical protein
MKKLFDNIFNHINYGLINPSFTGKKRVQALFDIGVGIGVAIGGLFAISFIIIMVCMGVKFL